jgi:hypothetical protein
MIKKWKQFNERVDCINDTINFEVLTNLQDERNSIIEGDEVIATYFTGGFDTYAFVVEKWYDDFTGENMYGTSDGDNTYLIDMAYHIVKLETYEAFVDPEERITESVEMLSKPKISKEEIREEAYMLVEDKINDIFNELHQEFGTLSGDIFPEQQRELTNLQKKISELIANQVYQNLPCGFESITTDSIDLESLRELTDERKEVKMGDEVIVIYEDPFEIVKFKVDCDEKGPGGIGHQEPINLSSPEDLFTVKPGWEFLKPEMGNWYPICGDESILLVVKVDTYNDFCDPSKRLD